VTQLIQHVDSIARAPEELSQPRLLSVIYTSVAEVVFIRSRVKKVLVLRSILWDFIDAMERRIARLMNGKFVLA
jgi:hypothetical protein